MKKLNALGKNVTAKKNAAENLEVFESPDYVTQVEMISDEFTAVCPVTGQPDLYTVKILYWPSLYCVESKSLKLYLGAFRNAGHFCENLAAIIKEDIQEITRCDSIEVTLIQKSRGGISIVATARGDL